MFDLSKYNSIVIYYDYNSKTLGENLYKCFKNIINKETELTCYNINDNIFSHAFYKKILITDLCLFINDNKIKKYKDRYDLIINDNIISEIRKEKINKILNK